MRSAPARRGAASRLRSVHHHGEAVRRPHASFCVPSQHDVCQQCMRGVPDDHRHGSARHAARKHQATTGGIVVASMRKQRAIDGQQLLARCRPYALSYCEGPLVTIVADACAQGCRSAANEAR